MTKDLDPELMAELRADAERIEREEMANPDTPYPPGTTFSYPNRSRTFTMRLRESEYDEMQRVADQHHLPASTLARAWLLDKLAGERRAS